MALKRNSYLPRLLIFFGIFFVQSKCLASEANNDSYRQKIVTFDRVNLLGFALQGNGGNYAATLSAIAESLDIHAERAIKLENQQNIRIGFMFPSFVGASSGSLVVSLASSLVKNELLFTELHNNRIFMPIEVQTLARAFRYLAFVADETLFERLMFVTKSGLSMLRGRVGIDQLSYQFGRLFDPAEHPNWWNNSIARSEAVLYDFTKIIFLAQNLNKQMLLERVHAVGLTRKYRNLARKSGWYYVSDLPIHERGKENPEGAMQLAAKVAQHIRAKSEERVKEAIMEQKYFPLLRHLINYDDPNRDSQHPLKKAMINNELADGFVTATFVLWKEDLKESDVAKLPNYLDQDLRPMVFANPQTAHKIKQHYNGNKFDCHEKNALVAAISHIHGALLPSTKEPELLEVHAGYANDSEKYSIKRIWDLENKKEFVIHADMSLSPWIGTLGGFINAASMARLAALQLYIKGKELSDINYSGPEFRSHLLIVGKPRKKGLVDFAQKKIEQLFSDGDPGIAKRNIRAVEQHANYDIERTIDYQEKSKQSGILSSANRLGIYWDISGTIPAAQAGKSYQLVYLIANEVRKQLDSGNHMSFSPLNANDLKEFTTEFGYAYDLYGKLTNIE